MVSFILNLFGGNKSKKDVQALLPIIDKINLKHVDFKTLSHDELRYKTQVFKKNIADYVADINDKIKDLNNKASQIDDANIVEKENIFKEIDNLEIKKKSKLEEILMQILPEAFAVVRETARRFKENKSITVIATDYDKELAVTKKHISINADKAIYKNIWSVGGADTLWNMVHYDVQLIGGIVLHQGKISEMATGEGKTLVSTLPAYLNALAGCGVHIVTVNEYLAKRDCEWNGPIFQFLGLRVDCIDLYEPHSEGRQKAYQADVTYGTNNEFGFDYLRDNMVHEADEIVQGNKHFFAMVDEVDSVLIDDARTPLIISGPTTKDDSQQRFFELKPRVEHLFESQKKLVNNFLIEAKEKLAKGNDDVKDGGLALFRAFRGLPKNGALIKFLSEPNVKVKLQKTENYYIAENQKLMPEADKELLFYIDEKNNSVELTEKGLNFITQKFEDKNFFVLPDLSVEIEQITSDHNLSNEEKIKTKEKLIEDYSIKADRIHSVQQLLKAYTLFEKDVQYVVLEEQVKIVDEQTGRIMDGRRYSDGLHQAIEAKENVKIEGASQTYATITLQNFFRMYHKLAGMTGTAETEAGELWQIYKLDVVSIPTNISIIRKDHQDLVFKTKREKYKAVIEEIEKLTKEERAVLVGTTSVEVSELLSRMLKQKNISHNVLNAKQHAREAQIVAEAGLPGKVTIATNMAGRGTDIKLHPTVKEKGGLAIIGTERHESRRVDRQLRGRAGRQGDPGSSQFYVCLEDNLMRMFGSERIASMMDRMGYKEGEVIQHKLVTMSIERAQKKVEENNFGIRKRLLEYDDVMNKQRNVIYKKRNNALYGDRLFTDIDNAFYFSAQNIIQNFQSHQNVAQTNIDILSNFSLDINIEKETGKNQKEIIDNLYTQALHHFQNKKELIATECLSIFKRVHLLHGNKFKNIALPFTDGKKVFQISINIEKTLTDEGKNIIQNVQKAINLIIIDDAWKEHLRLMDELRHSVQSAVYEQKDPLVIYKVESFNLFEKLYIDLNFQTASFLSHCRLLNEQEKEINFREAKKENQTGIVEKRTEDNLTENTSQTKEKQMPIIVENKVGRNDACPCGSGKKYKSCHGK